MIRINRVVNGEVMEVSYKHSFPIAINIARAKLATGVKGYFVLNEGNRELVRLALVGSDMIEASMPLNRFMQLYEDAHRQARSIEG